MAKHARIVVVISVSLLAFLLSACGNPAPAANSSAATPAKLIRTNYPVSVTDCRGTTVTFNKAPTRVVTLDPAVLDILLVLGLKSHIVGITLFDVIGPNDHELWSVTKADVLTLPRVNDPNIGYPSKEKIISLNPDFVVSAYPSAFDPSSGPSSQAGWAQLGINSYLTHGGCGDQAVWTDLSVLYQDIHDFGVIFDVQARAAAEIAHLETQVLAQQQRVKDAHLPEYSIGMHNGLTDHPGTMGTTAANAMITLAGSRYAFLHDDCANCIVSWEIFVKRNPDVIWLLTYQGESAQQIAQQLESDPRTAEMPAVKNKRFFAVGYDDVVESPRIIDGLTALVSGLIALQPSAHT